MEDLIDPKIKFVLKEGARAAFAKAYGSLDLAAYWPFKTSKSTVPMVGDALMWDAVPNVTFLVETRNFVFGLEGEVTIELYIDVFVPE